MAYVELEEIKDTLSLTGETYADDNLRPALDAATDIIEKHCGRSFLLDEEPSERLFVPRIPYRLDIDDLVADDDTVVEYDVRGTGTFTAIDPYTLYPLNAIDHGKPYTSLQVPRYGMCQLIEERYEPLVRITGTWGWPAVPPGIKEATTILTARLLKRVREAPFGIAGIGGDGIAVRITNVDPDVETLLGPYAKGFRLA